MTANEMQARIEELETRLAAATTPKPSNHAKAPVVVVDGVTLMDQPGKASAMKRLAAASYRNLDKLIPLRLKAMKLGGKQFRIIYTPGVQPCVEVNLNDGQTALFALSAGTGDWTDYYLTQV